MTGPAGSCTGARNSVTCSTANAVHFMRMGTLCQKNDGSMSICMPSVDKAPCEVFPGPCVEVRSATSFAKKTPPMLIGTNCPKKDSKTSICMPSVDQKPRVFLPGHCVEVH